MVPKGKITVLKKNLDSELAQQYCQNEVTTCPAFTEGQDFITGFEKPRGFVIGHGTISLNFDSFTLWR